MCLELNVIAGPDQKGGSPLCTYFGRKDIPGQRPQGTFVVVVGGEAEGARWVKVEQALMGRSKDLILVLSGTRSPSSQNHRI